MSCYKNGLDTLVPPHWRDGWWLAAVCGSKKAAPQQMAEKNHRLLRMIPLRTCFFSRCCWFFFHVFFFALLFLSSHFFFMQFDFYKLSVFKVTGWIIFLEVSSQCRLWNAIDFFRRFENVQPNQPHQGWP